jgi:hypothetical protein
VGVVDHVIREAGVVATIVHLPSVSHEEKVVVYVIPAASIIGVESLRGTIVRNNEVVCHI